MSTRPSASEKIIIHFACFFCPSTDLKKDLHTTSMCTFLSQLTYQNPAQSDDYLLPRP